MMPQLSSADRELLQQAADWQGPTRLEELDGSLLCEIARANGVDFATVLLYQAICNSAAHGPFVRRMEELLTEAAADVALDAALAIAPGAFYREHPETGADGQSLCRMAASLGCRTYVIPLQSLGTCAVNGRIICDWLRNSTEENIILCSLSKGGADVKRALAEPDAAEAFRKVAAWLDVGGIMSGSPMATWVLKRPWLAMIYRMLFWWRGQDFRFVEDIARRTGSSLDFPLVAPPHIRIIHVLGFPLARHIRRRQTRRWHRRLACHGPNDGATILADACGLPGLIFPVWGADHYLDAVHTPEQLLSALLRYLAESRPTWAETESARAS
jgi:hypothetical protein